MPIPSDRFPNLRIFLHPLIQQKLTRLRDRRTVSADFRHLLNQIAGLMTYEISRDLPTAPVEIETPLEPTVGTTIARPITLVPILRAGVGMTDGILSLMPEARVGHIGLYRNEADLTPVAYYAKFPPDMASGPVLLIDPMLATGGSAVHAVRELKARRCTDVRFVCLVCAPEGVARMHEAHPDVIVYTASLDRALDAKGYIRPGLGDAGDRIFGTS